MPKYQIPEAVTHVAIGGREYDAADGILEIDEAHSQGVHLAQANGYVRLPDIEKKPLKLTRKSD